MAGSATYDQSEGFERFEQLIGSSWCWTTSFACVKSLASSRMMSFDAKLTLVGERF